MYKGYDQAVKAGDTAEAWGRAVGGALTLNVSEAGITAYEWARGRATAEQFGESLGGVAMSAAGLKGMGRLGAQLGKSVSGLGTRAATVSLLKQAGGMALDTALPMVGRAGLGLGRAGLGLTGQGLGAAVRGAFRTGNEGGRTNALARLVHNADGSHNKNFVGRQAQRLAEWTGTKACFTGRMPMRTPTGSKLASQVWAGDLLLSRDENNPDGLVVAQMVEEVFVREALVMSLRVHGIDIETTAEHPFYVWGRGWIECFELREGDLLRLEDGWAPVEAVVDTGRWETVYNFWVSAFHTYFVGCDEWCLAVWAHNMCGPEDIRRASGKAGLTDEQLAQAGRTPRRMIAGKPLARENAPPPRPTTRIAGAMSRARGDIFS